MNSQNTDLDEEVSKILFTGLDDAGKSSIILSLQREFDKIAVIKPTRGADRREFFFLGKKISEWDLGGQISYRLTYLKNFQNYFADTDVAIYVIDIQNKGRIREALGYLYDIVDRFALLRIAPPIYLFLHKSDPALTDTYRESISSDIKNKIEENIKYKKISFHYTTIHDMATIISIMSEIMTKVYPKAELIEEGIKIFAKQLKSPGVMVMDNNSLLIGSFYEDDEIKTLLDGSVPYLLTLNDRMVIPSIEGVTDQMTVTKLDKSFVLKKLVLGDGISFYLLVLKNSPEFDVSVTVPLVTLLKEFLDL